MWGDIPSESERPHAPGRDGSVQDCSRVVSRPLGRARYGEMWGDAWRCGETQGISHPLGGRRVRVLAEG